MVEFAKIAWPASLDPSLITWTAGRRRPSRFCSLCGTRLGTVGDDDDEAELMVWKEDGACARFCAGCMERHWGMRAEPADQPETPIQPSCAKRCSLWRRQHGKCDCARLGLIGAAQ
jgi:hypothetical protein